MNTTLGVKKLNLPAIFFAFVIIALMNLSQCLTPAQAVNQWVDCVVIKSAGLSPFPTFGYPQYEISLYNGCQSDMGGVTLDFDSGSFDVWGLDNHVSIWNLSSWTTTKSFSLEKIKPGFYFPSLKITATQDYSTRRLNLPSFTIQAPIQPSLGDNGGIAVLPKTTINSKQVCSYSKIAGQNCTEYPNWTYSICSTSFSGVLQEKVGTTWVKLWNFKGSKDATCDSKYPYLIRIDGSTKRTTGETQLRLVFTKTTKSPAWYDYFTLSLP